MKIRLGGSLQDKVVYESNETRQHCTQFVKNSSEMFGFSQGCLPMSRWDDLNIFFKTARAVVIFGLNALSGKTIDPHGFAIGAWNSTNAESLIQYTADKGYTIHGWELGNELSGSGVGARISADQYASDVISLRNIVQNVYKGFEVKPLVIAPGGFLDKDWYKEFIHRASKSLQVVTQHIYNLGAGIDDHLVEKILDPLYLDQGSHFFKDLQSIIKSSASSATAWVGEAGGAYNSGRDLVTNGFVFSFWYLDQLGMAASYGTRTYCRQTLIGGNYGLLNTKTFVPNPDYYSALLWHRLMGAKVLSTTFSGTKNIRAYAHCSKISKGITLLLINLSSNTTVQVHVSMENAPGNRTSPQEHRKEMTKLSSIHGNFESNGDHTREEYHLTAKDGNLHSQTMLLNGKTLSVKSSGNIPLLEPVYVTSSAPISVAPFSILFAHIPTINLPACN